MAEKSKTLSGVRVVEATAKRYKARIALGWLAAIAGVVVMMSSGEQTGLAVASAAAALAGIGLVIWGKLAAWWHHG